jgi:hypothetical protein
MPGDAAATGGSLIARMDGDITLVDSPIGPHHAACDDEIKIAHTVGST